MEAVKAGGDRQDLHESIRHHSVAAARAVKEEGRANDLLERLAEDPGFAVLKGKFGTLTDPGKFCGRAPQQVDEFCENIISPIRKKYAGQLGMTATLHV